MDELDLFEELAEGLGKAQERVKKARVVVEAQGDKPNNEAVRDIRTELGVSPLFALRPMYATQEEAQAASADASLQEISHLEEAIETWVLQPLEDGE